MQERKEVSASETAKRTTVNVQVANQENIFAPVRYKQYITEFAASFVLAFVHEAMSSRINLRNLNSILNVQWLTLGAMTLVSLVASLVYSIRYLSGAHFNPAVTLSIMLRYKFSRKGVLATYIIVQLIGGVAGVLFFDYFFGLHGGYIIITRNIQIPFICEFLFTTLLIIAYYETIYTNSPTLKKNSYFGAVIGGIYMVAYIVIGPISGGLINPMIWFGGFSRKLFGSSRGSPNVIILIAQLLAAVVVAAVSRLGIDEQSDCPPYQQVIITTANPDRIYGGFDQQKKQSKVVELSNHENPEYFYPHPHLNPQQHRVVNDEDFINMGKRANAYN